MILTIFLENDVMPQRPPLMLIGLPVPVADIVDVNLLVIKHSLELRIEVCGRKTLIPF